MLGEEEVEEDEENSLAVMQLCWYFGACFGALLLSFRPPPGCEARAIFFVVWLTLGDFLGI